MIVSWFLQLVGKTTSNTICRHKLSPFHITVTSRPMSSFDPNADDAISKKQSTANSRSSDNDESSVMSAWDFPGRSTSNRGGLDVAQRQIRSLLFHPLGLPLHFAFLEKKTEDMKYLPQTRTRFKQHQIDTLDGLFQRAVEDAKDSINNDDDGDNKVNKDKTLAGCLTQLIEEQREILSYGALSEVPIKDKKANTTGFLDMILTPAEKKVQSSDTTPLAVLEFGWNADDWWKSFQRGTRYLEQMMRRQKCNCLNFDKPILLVIVTVDKHRDILSDSIFRIGVFLCEHRRLCLLWHSQTSSLSNASILFGKFLRVTTDFASWRENSYQTESGYEYLSPNCCKVITRDNDGEETRVVLRCYDNRAWKTDRNPEVYLSGVVGDVEVIFGDTNFGNHHVDTKEPPNPFEELWTRSSQDLLITAVPYRDGRHYAESPADFLPIIGQLQALHKAGFVHGDIRAYNIVFKDDKEGWLIDFDFGGKSDVQTYPKGYQSALSDGIRMGTEGEAITKHHDWYALGTLMFTIHKIPTDALTTVEMFRLKDHWTLLKEDECMDEDIEALKDFLGQFVGRRTTMELHPPFEAAVKENTTKALITKKGATGSPLESVEGASESVCANPSPVAVPLPVPSSAIGPAVAPALSPPTSVAAATLPPTPVPATAPAVALQSPLSFQLQLLVKLECHGAVSMTSGPVFDGETSHLSVRKGCFQSSIAGCWSMTLWNNVMSIWLKRLFLQNTYVLMSP
ncbi:RIO1 family protein [Nitzschia inconspicua]|uniref:RIO1 family protein n=1 Tax=Nitzschia inconspicua TaxID=303405 RepID=A0A9K3K5U5_9STRA|nr:RIO1 family protein [Nitzschia inconspicua]KAG7358063.1 RIO1 family protein [Nitzschia inconspicua]